MRLKLIAVGALTVVNSIPSLEDLSGSWFDPSANFSAHVEGSELDLPVLANFWGSVGTGLASRRPVDLIGISSLEIHPYAGCGISQSANETNYFGCGRMRIDGKSVAANGVKYQADQASRRSGPLPNGLTIESQTRMGFEQYAVLWEVEIKNPTESAVASKIEFELAATITQYSHLKWVNPLAFSPADFRFTDITSEGMRGVMSEGKQPATNTSKPASGIRKRQQLQTGTVTFFFSL
jgi:hypothetical protein